MNIVTNGIIGLVLGATLCSCECHTARLKVDEPRAMFNPYQRTVTNDTQAMKNVYFAFDKYDLSDASKSTLRNNAEWLQANTTVDIKIEGHADERGTNEYNMMLGANRASAATNYLHALGIQSERMSSISYGEELPVDASHTEAAWAKNR